MTVMLTIGGCMTQDAPKVVTISPVVAPPPKAPERLSDEAESALKAAEQSVIEARVRRALWTSAVEKLEYARNAASKLDSNATLEYAKEVVALCALSLQQTSAPPVRW